MISSPNLKTVIGKLTRAQAALPQKIREVTAAETWISDLRTVAFETMHAVAESTAEIEAIPVIMESLSVTETGDGSAFSLHAAPLASLDKAFDPIELTSNQDFRQRLIDWVEQYKIKDERDEKADGEPLSNAQIASRVAAAIRNDPRPWVNTDEPGRGALNPEGLAMITGLTGMTAPQASLMLTAVLASWLIFVRQNIGSIAVSKIREAFA